MNKNSTYWLNNPLPGNFDLIGLANTQRAISNFIKILTGKEIPVEFYESNMGDSMTNGKKIAISSTINMHNIDSVVGLAIHEGAHCIYTNFKVLKKREIPSRRGAAGAPGPPRVSKPETFSFFGFANFV